MHLKNQVNVLHIVSDSVFNQIIKRQVFCNIAGGRDKLSTFVRVTPTNASIHFCSHNIEMDRCRCHNQVLEMIDDCSKRCCETWLWKLLQKITKARNESSNLAIQIRKEKYGKLI